MTYRSYRGVAHRSLVFPFLLGAVLALAQAPVEPVRSLLLDSSVLADGASLPVADKGFVLVRKHLSFAYSGPNVYAYERNGKLFASIKLWFPDVVKVWVHSLAISPEGVIAASTSADTGDGKAAYTVCLIDPPGKLARIVRTNPFLATHLTFGPDGTIWAMGRNVRAEDAGEDFMVFERYSGTGAVLGRYVPRSTFHVRTLPDEVVGAGGGTALWASAGRVFAYTGPTKEWFEFDNSGGLLTRWEVPLPAERAESGQGRIRRVYGVAVTQSGRVFMRLGQGGTARIFLLNRDKRNLEPVSETLLPSNAGNRPGNLYGTDGEQLVFHGSSASGLSLIWYPAQALAP